MQSSHPVVMYSVNKDVQNGVLLLVFYLSPFLGVCSSIMRNFI